MYHRLTVNFAFPADEWKAIVELYAESNQSYSSHIKEIVHNHYQQIIKERSNTPVQGEPNVRFLHPSKQFVEERCVISPDFYITHTDLWKACRKYYQEEHSDIPARNHGGRRRLFATLDRTDGVARVNQPNGRLKGFRGIDLRQHRSKQYGSI